MFVDKVKVFFKGGNGGHGAVAWRREKFEPSGGPAGGDGGHGGSVILKVDEGINTLADFRYKKHFKAKSGENGKSKGKYGKNGENIIISVPPGTIIKDEETNRVIADLVDKDETFVIAKGGRGGRGNKKFTSSTRQAPSFAEGGSKGEEIWAVLELKMIADVGLIGFPNVGKSTLLSTVSQAKPKIANYHFTTINPNLGVVRVGNGKSFVMADIPGLIEGAHAGVGLGHQFLRHVERTKLLVHIIDVSFEEGRDPVDDFHKINKELNEYNEKLANRPQIVVANKMDLPRSQEGFEKLKKETDKLGFELFSISAVTKKGIDKLKYVIYDKLQNIGDLEPIIETDLEKVVYEPKKKEKGFEVRKENGKYLVEGPVVERLLDSVNFDSFESMSYFQKRLRDLGIIKELRDLGIDEEETVNVCGYEFEFID
ncbi:MAG: GTPase ObgE [Firmicutes bacterium]|nr:GTPase ObgE [Bacillota bacterium]